MTAANQETHNWIEEVFETVLFNCRFLVLVPVFGILVAAAVMFVKGSIEIIEGIELFTRTFAGVSPSAADDTNVLLSFIPAIDSYLFATILLIISMGLYELFISKIDPRSTKHHPRPDWLMVKDLDDLKSHIGEVVVMILIVTFFKLSFNIQYDRPADLLSLGGGILMVTVALVVTHYASARRKKASAL
jgi:uncharacterized protein (TIGR00645 family)